MPPVTCPSCRNVQEVAEPPRYDHDEFCDRCHYRCSGHPATHLRP
jgi:hypothetical protein